MLISALKYVFSSAKYFVLAISSALALFVLSIWLPNIGLIWKVLSSTSVGAIDKGNILIRLLGGIQTNFSSFSAIYTIVLAILFGINVSMVVYYFKKNNTTSNKKDVIPGITGAVSGILGVGCIACGTLALGPFLSLIGVGGLIAILPFGGQEFGILGIVLLAFSIYITAKKISDPIVCEIKDIE